MKKLLFAIMLTGLLFSMNAQGKTSFWDRLRFDINTSALVPSSQSAAFAPAFGFGFSSYDLDVMALGRLALYDMGSVNPRNFIQGLLRTDVKFHLSDSPLIILGGLGVGYSIGNDLPNPAFDGTPATSKRTSAGGISMEITSGVMFPLNQNIAALARLGYAYNNFRINDLTALNYSGFIMEIGVRVALGNTVPLQY